VGDTLVAPKAHREEVTGDFSLEEYLRLQTLVYRVGEAIRATVATERLYVMSYGSRQGISHVHWHLVPLPPGVPFERQQSFATNPRNGVLEIPEEDLAEMAGRIRQAMQNPPNEKNT
jgi:ATP adenylyltransferase